MAEPNVLKPGTSIKPKISLEECRSLVNKLYGLECRTIEELNGYDDRNYKILVSSRVENQYITHLSVDGYVLKILNSLDSRNGQFMEAQTALLIFLNDNNINCPKPVKNKHGKYLSLEKLQSGHHIVRLLEFIPGKLLHEVPQSKQLSYNIGMFVGNLDLVLKKFHDTTYKSYKSIWMLNSLPDVRQFLFVIEEEEKRKVFNDVIGEFYDNVLKKYDQLEQGLIHGDVNEQNIIVEKKDDEEEWFVKAILDFGDAHYSCYLFEIALAMTYVMLTTKSLDAGGFVLAGYSKIKSLSAIELPLLKICIEARLTQSLVLGAYSYSQDPGNDYVLTTSKDGWNLLQLIRKESRESLLERWNKDINV